MKDWKDAAKEAISKAKDGEHAWFNFKEDQFQSCAKCGVVKRKDGNNKSCPGKVKIGFRN